ncbi:hypothetical protein [Speluncibacter jeojiensis]|uniref:Uncharacterized protein n=1 Tax=Speluncibacter jeojiensis TaxID=2710754 RepID=A0A9X4LVP0_9ACTN|nr:hypothetical protein [Rhodococcus sp. D2-41]MDG3013153.1 hypothetical protein [Corynebacteriales bacterium D3-21]
MGYLRACYRLPMMLAGSVVSTTASGRLCAMGARLRLNLARA